MRLREHARRKDGAHFLGSRHEEKGLADRKHGHHVCQWAVDRANERRGDGRTSEVEKQAYRDVHHSDTGFAISGITCPGQRLAEVHDCAVALTESFADACGDCETAAIDTVAGAATDEPEAL